MAGKVSKVTVETVGESKSFLAEERWTMPIGKAGRPYSVRVAVFRSGMGPVVQPEAYQRSAGITGRAFLAFLRSDAGRDAWLAAERMAADMAAKYPKGAPAWDGPARGAGKTADADIDIG